MNSNIMQPIMRHWPFVLAGVLGAIALGIVASANGEQVNSAWLMTATLCIDLTTYRFYSMIIANDIFKLYKGRPTPAVLYYDGKDFVPTNKYILFGIHFTWIAGAGPFFGPVLSLEMGYQIPLIWIVIGCPLCGAVHDMTILALSVRCGARSITEMVRDEMGTFPGAVSTIGSWLILNIIVAVLALSAIRVMGLSPWSVFQAACTIPIALLMFAYTRWVRPGRQFESALIGFALFVASVIEGGNVASDPQLAAIFTLTPVQITQWVLVYSFIACLIPVTWLMQPRDYLSSFMKIGTIAALVICLFLTHPDLVMPAMTKFVSGGGPVLPGSAWPLVFYTLACGAISGFHGFINGGPTARAIQYETDIRMIGYGGMLLEGVTAMVALIAGAILDPGIYFSMNVGPAILGTTPDSAAAAVTAMGFAVTPGALTDLARSVGETTMISRVGGAPTLAVGMGKLLSVMGGEAWLPYWYHSIAGFEVIFIWGAVDGGNRANRYIVQGMLGSVYRPLGSTSSIIPAAIGSLVAVGGSGTILWQGVTDPFGGISALWPLFGISNQMLAACSLILVTVAIFRMKKHRYAWITVAPAVFLIAVTMTGGSQKIFSDDPKMGFLAHASKFQAALDKGQILAPAKTTAEMSKVIFNDYLDASLCGFFGFMVLTMIIFGIRSCWLAYRNPQVSTREDLAPPCRHGNHAPMRCC